MDHRIGSRTGTGYGGRSGGGIRVVVVGGVGIVVVAVCGKRRHIVVSCIQDGTTIGRLESRWSQVAGRMDAPSFAPRPQKDRLDKRIKSVLGGYRARPDRHTEPEAYRERVRRRPRDKRSMCAQRTLSMWIQILPLRPVGGPPNHRLGSGRPATRWTRHGSMSSSNRGAALSCRGSTATTAAQCAKPSDVYYGRYIASLPHK
jgi:hypothetical protein